MNDLEEKTFVVLVIVITLAFAWILWPFFGAILWATLLAILFTPLYRRLLTDMPARRNVAALLTLLAVILIVILPLWLLAMSLVREGTGLYESAKAGDFNLQPYILRLRAITPGWVLDYVDRIAPSDFSAFQDWLASALTRSGQFLAGQALNIGQGAADLVLNLFVMLYLLFFLLRDGDGLVGLIGRALPLPARQRRTLFARFALAIRGTVRGNIMVALVQGALGGAIFWWLDIRAPVLWGALMAILSLVPVLGAAVIWAPVALYLAASGNLTDGLILLGYGALIIGLADNFLRPILVGQSIRMPDYVVLVSTLGGIAIFGLNGFVIGPVLAAMFLATWGLVLEEREGDRREGQPAERSAS